MRNTTIWTTAALVAALSGSALAEDRRVPSQYATIQEAVDAAVSSDRIVLAKGVYNESVTVVGKNGLVFMGSGAIWEHVDRQGGAQDCLTVTGNDITVTGLRFRHGNNQVVINGDRPTVTNCVFRNAGNTALTLSGGSPEVLRCKFVGAGDVGADVSGPNASICRNLFDQCDEYGLEVNGMNARIERNTFRNVQDEYAIDLDGAGAVITRNRFVGCDNEAIYLFNADNAQIVKNRIDSSSGGVYAQGNGVLVEANRITHFDDNPAVEVDGDDSTVRRNRIAYGGSDGVRCDGDRVVVESNRISWLVDGDGVDVTGNEAEILRNRINFVSDDAYGVVLDGESDGRVTNFSDGSLVERNVAIEIIDTGFRLTIANSDVVRNTATRCGAEDEAGFDVTGDDNSLTGNKASDCDDDGFDVDGSRNVLVGCSAKNCTDSGFDITGGADNELRNCSATNNDGEGLQNEADATIAVGGSYRGNRIDVTNDGSFAELDVNFVTGGETTPYEVD